MSKKKDAPLLKESIYKIDAMIDKLFKEYDTDNNGIITLEEVQTVFAKKKHNATLEQLKELFDWADRDGDHKINLNEFRVAVHQVIAVRKLFKKLDKDNSGTIDVQELEDFVVIDSSGEASESSLAEVARELMKTADTDGDDQLSFEEFARLYLRHKRGVINWEEDDEPEDTTAASSTTTETSSPPSSPSSQSEATTPTAPHHSKNLHVVVHPLKDEESQEEAFLEWLYISKDVYDIEDGIVQLKVKPAWDILPVRLALGGMSCGAATLFTNPVDVIKVHMQLDRVRASAASGGVVAQKPATMLQTFVKIIKMDRGILNLWNGFQAALVRAATYSATRLAFYSPMKVVTGADKHPTLVRKIFAGCLSGSLAAAIANPVEVVKVRIQADPKRYKSTFEAFRSLIQVEGMSGICSGLIPHIFRGAAITASQISTYDYIKHLLLESKLVQKEGIAVHFASSMIAGLVTTTISSPFDVIKTQMMNSSKSSGENRGLVTVVSDLYSTQGVKGFFRGWVPNYARLGPHTVITLIIFERLRSLVGLDPI